MPRDICKLCREEKELQRSHLIPRRVYDYCRNEDASPVRVGDGVIMPTDRQLQDYLLCLDCESLLNKKGEEWIVNDLATMDRTFPFYDLIVSGPSAFEDADGGLYYASLNPKIDVDKLTHFAMGIFWKAAVHSWSGGKRDPLIQLGPYAEPVRAWLKGEAGFPKNVTLEVAVARPERAQIILTQPWEIPRGRWRTFVFHVPGVIFTMQVGKEIDQETRAFCFHEQPDHPILVSDTVIGKMERNFIKHYRDSRKTRAYLAMKANRARAG